MGATAASYNEFHHIKRKHTHARRGRKSSSLMDLVKKLGAPPLRRRRMFVLPLQRREDGRSGQRQQVAARAVGRRHGGRARERGPASLVRAPSERVGCSIARVTNAGMLVVGRSIACVFLYLSEDETVWGNLKTEVVPMAKGEPWMDGWAVCHRQ